MPNMMKLSRIYQPDCTVGILTFDKFRCFTLELPDLDNATNISCIPEGTYKVTKHNSPSKGECLKIHNVVGRSNILIHIGNYTSDILGCILVGERLADIDGDSIPDVTSSSKTLRELLSTVPDELTLRIK